MDRVALRDATASRAAQASYRDAARRLARSSDPVAAIAAGIAANAARAEWFDPDAPEDAYHLCPACFQYLFRRDER